MTKGFGSLFELYCRVVCICWLACPEWVKGAVEPIIAMGFVCSKRSVAVVGMMGF